MKLHRKMGRQKKIEIDTEHKARENGMQNYWQHLMAIPIIDLAPKDNGVCGPHSYTLFILSGISCFFFFFSFLVVLSQRIFANASART